MERIYFDCDCPVMELQECVNVDNDEFTWEKLTDENILNLCQTTVKKNDKKFWVKLHRNV